MYKRLWVVGIIFEHIQEYGEVGSGLFFGFENITKTLTYMHSPKTLKSASAPLVIIGLCIALLWGALFFKGSAGVAHRPESQDQGLFPIALPTVLAPVIRKEVHKKDGDEPSKALHIFKLPGLFQYLNVKQ